MKDFCIFCEFIHSVSAILPSGQLSNVPWRRTGVKYTNNEAYFDVVEEVDAIIDRTGATVFAEIQGYVSEVVSYTDNNYTIYIYVINLLDRLLYKTKRYARSYPFIYESKTVRRRQFSSLRSIQKMGGMYMNDVMLYIREN